MLPYGTVGILWDIDWKLLISFFLLPFYTIKIQGNACIYGYVQLHWVHVTHMWLLDRENRERGVINSKILIGPLLSPHCIPNPKLLLVAGDHLSIDEHWPLFEMGSTISTLISARDTKRLKENFLTTLPDSISNKFASNLLNWAISILLSQ